MKYLTPCGQSSTRLYLTMTGLFALLALAACQGGMKQSFVDVAQDAAVGVQRNLSTAEITALKDTCTAAGPGLVVAVSSAAPKPVADTAVYPYAFCKELLFGDGKNPADHTSLQWLPAVLNTVTTVAKVASFVLPLLL